MPRLQRRDHTSTLPQSQNAANPLSAIQDRADTLVLNLSNLVDRLRNLDGHVKPETGFGSYLGEDEPGLRASVAPSLASHPGLLPRQASMSTVYKQTTRVEVYTVFDLDPTSTSTAMAAASPTQPTVATSQNALSVLSSVIATPDTITASVPKTQPTDSASSDSTWTSTTTRTSTITSAPPAITLTPSSTSTSTSYVYASTLPASTPSPQPQPEPQPDATLDAQRGEAVPIGNLSGVISGCVIGGLMLAGLFVFVCLQNRKRRKQEKRDALSHNIMPWHPPADSTATLMESINTGHGHLMDARSMRTPAAAPPMPPQALTQSHLAPPIQSEGTFYSAAPSRRRPSTSSSDRPLHHAQPQYPQTSFPPAHYDDLPDRVPAPRRQPNPPAMAEWSPIQPPAPLFAGGVPRFPPNRQMGSSGPRQSDVQWQRRPDSNSTETQTRWSFDSLGKRKSYNPFDLPQFP